MSSMRPLILLLACSVMLSLRLNPMLQTTYLETRGALVQEQSLHEFRKDPVRIKKQLPLPVTLMEDYKQQHNSHIIRREVHSKTRKYVLAPYSCPDRAGNALHNVYNSVIWAVATNRTLLLHFDESNTNHNTLQDCEEALRLQSWVPLWNDMKDYLPRPVPIPLDISRRRFDDIHSVVIYPQIPNVMADWKGIPITENDWDDHPYKAVDEDFLSDMPKIQQFRLNALYSNGIDFLYGMMFRELFHFQFEKPKGVFSENDRSIVLHSRHTVNADDGTYTNEEEDCLHQLLNRSDTDSTKRTCTIYLLSDRIVTVDKLVDFLNLHYPNCQVQRNNATQQRNSMTGKRALEHGANPGVGFFEDLALAIRARSGIIGEQYRSSFKLIHEIITYDSFMEKAQELVPAKLSPNTELDLEVIVKQSDGSNQMVGEMEMCSLGHRKGKGYSYPGSPTFIRRERLPILGPTKEWNLYRERHKQSTLESEFQGQGPKGSRLSKRLFAIAHFSCDDKENLQNNYLELIHRFVLSMLARRTTLVHSDNPDCYQQIAAWIPRWDEWSQKLNLTLPPLRPSVDAKTIEFPKQVLSLSLSEKSQLSSTLQEFGPRFLQGLVGRELFAPMRTKDQLLKRHEDVVFLDSDFSVALDLNLDTSGLFEKSRICLSKILDKVHKPIRLFLLEGERNSSETKSIFNELSEKWSSINVTRSRESNTMKGSTLEFWSSWAVGGRARHAWIGPEESMVRNEIEYQRVMEARSIGVFPFVVKDLPSCSL